MPSPLHHLYEVCLCSCQLYSIQQCNRWPLHPQMVKNSMGQGCQDLGWVNNVLVTLEQKLEENRKLSCNQLLGLDGGGGLAADDW